MLKRLRMRSALISPSVLARAYDLTDEDDDCTDCACTE